MSSTHDVISALLDDEAFDPEELRAALDDPAGRAMLIDLAALRRIVRPRDAVPPLAAPARGDARSWRLLAAAAVLLVALAGGYAAGVRRGATEPVAEAPPPTRVVQAVPFTPTGGTP